MYINKKMTYKEAIVKAESIKNLGIDEIYLDSDYPWQLVTSCEPGGSHRLEIATDVWFYAYDPKTELNFRWSFDIEPRSANGSSSYHINVEGIRDVLSRLGEDAKIQFRQYLAGCALKIKSKGDEWMKAAMEQQSAAKILHEI